VLQINCRTFINIFFTIGSAQRSALKKAHKLYEGDVYYKNTDCNRNCDRYRVTEFATAGIAYLYRTIASVLKSY
jgi:hypothetical protein